ncbi:MAG TPA: hypothetical protein VKV15_02430 [Bryobacteraceae bacterium]|nr:hypothetical protein [Bryobacteraceae bacterium]
MRGKWEQLLASLGLNQEALLLCLFLVLRLRRGRARSLLFHSASRLRQEDYRDHLYVAAASEFSLLNAPTTLAEATMNTVPDGRQTVELAEAEDPDVVVMDNRDAES